MIIIGRWSTRSTMRADTRSASETMMFSLQTVTWKSIYVHIMASTNMPTSNSRDKVAVIALM